RPVTRFVAERPDDNAGIILVSLYHAPMPAKYSLFPTRIVQQLVIDVGAHRVRFDIGLANDVDAIARAKLIPKRDVRIMTSANRIDITLFHQFDIADHRGLTNDVSGFR